ncbi:MAG: hypothetical protein KatS3mg002_1516 [Candidatus Woesearchaeota archaeon]|nr:MAG: hypothetical protein KatS3mg002_1516 [Candidatus Woesearchaeota archaeon]
MDGLIVPKILLPKKASDADFMKKWAVIAVDQYTSEPDYWKKVEELTNNHKSTYHLILPEIFLEEPDVEERIKKINDEMNRYLSEKIFDEFEGFILVDRQTRYKKSRKGLIVALDLEHYDYSKGSKTLIRATEGTIIERLPPRIKIRKNASMELPHIMVLIDDPEKTVIEPLFEKNFEKLYDFDLMMDSGHIKGYKIPKNDTEQIIESLEKLKKKSNDGMLFAMGDGNHSLATAKAIWEDMKKNNPKLKDHPSRYALVELVNLHDEGLEFEPIHRIIFNVEKDDLFSEMKKFYDNVHFSELRVEKKGSHCIEYIHNGKSGFIIVNNPNSNLEVGTLQSFLDYYSKLRNKKIDYIHGENVVKKISVKDNIGFILPAMPKSELFRTVIIDGALPRKTFSMGEASEKRFYLEARKIV